LQQRQRLAAIGQRYTDIVWAAGLFEGEGCINNKKQDRQRNITVAMCDKDVMERFVDVIGYGNLNGPYLNKLSTKPFWRWDCAKKSEVLRILKMFLPHLGKRRAEKAIEAITHLNEITN
tara:strand:- start:687 stop:1043 length:357 start_codon:yes stop_codon:yes gene_type:complete